MKLVIHNNSLLRNLLRGILAVAFLYFVAYPAFIRLLNSGNQAHEQLGLYLVALFLMTSGLNAWIRYFQKVHNRSVNDIRVRVPFCLYIAVPLAYIVCLSLPEFQFDLDLFHYSLWTALFAVFNHHLSNAAIRAKATVLHRVLVFGVGAQAEMVADTLRRSDPNVQVVGFYQSPNEEQIAVSPEMIIGKNQSLADVVNELKVDELVVALSERRGGAMPLRELLDIRLQGTRVFDLASFFEENFGQIRLDSLYAGWLIFGDGFRQGALRSAVKRLFDIVFACILLILTAPLMLITAVLIVLESGFPIFYSQERVGLNGRLLKVIKFRSMRTDAEKDGKARWAVQNDNRVTAVGKILRKVRIDELPQLFCVLMGDMSLVGPRPERPTFVEQLTKDIPFYAARHSVKPGVTGWAQVRYHYCSSIEDSAEKLQYDLYYVKHHTLFFDLVVLFDTIAVVLTGRGAH